MTNLITLLKKDILTSFIFKIPHMLRDKNERKKLILYPIVFALVGLYAYLLVAFVIDFIGVYDSLGKGSVYLEQAFLAYTMLAIFGMVPTLISNFYYSNDVSMLLTLPVKPSEILTSKIISSSIFVLSSALITILPFVIKYIDFYSKGLGFGVLMLILTLVYTILITSLVAFVVVAMMSVVNRFARAKNLLQILGTLFIIGLSVMLSTFLNSPEIQTRDITNVASMVLSRVEGALKINPFNSFISMAINGNILGLVILIALAALVIYITSTLGSRLLLVGVLNNQAVSKRKKISAKEKENIYKPSSPLMQVFKKDFLQIIRTPVYMLNTFAMGILVPLIMVAPLWFNRNSIFGGDLEFSQIYQVYDLLESEFSIPLIFAFTFIASLALFSFINSSAAMTSGTSITREGKNIWLMQTLPINYKDQILGRILSAFVVGFLSTLPITLLIIFFTRMPIYMLLAFLLASFVMNIFNSIIGIWKDAGKPKLNWDTPQKAMKQNINTMILIYLSMGISGLLGFSIWYIGFSLGISDDLKILLFLGIGLIFIVMSLLLYIDTLRKFKKKLSTYN